jgi:hypothetical protein
LDRFWTWTGTRFENLFQPSVERSPLRTFDLLSGQTPNLHAMRAGFR